MNLNKIKEIIKSNTIVYRLTLKIVNFVTKLLFYIKNGSYSNKDYWEKRGETFNNEDYQKGIYDQHYWILEKIREYKPKNILEIGCGFGRNIKFIKDNLDYNVNIVGIDISSNLIDKAKVFLTQYDNVDLYVSDILSLDKTIGYDLILIHGVFMHISKKDFEVNRKYLRSINFNHLLEVEEVKDDGGGKIYEENINGFTFSHNYLNLNENIIEKRIVNNLIWLDIKNNV